MVNSKCLMLATSLYTPVDIGCVIDSYDLKDDGIIKDTHITLVYDSNGESSLDTKNSIMLDVSDALGEEFEVFMSVLEDSYKFKVLDVFEIGSFNNEDSSYLVLKLKPGQMYDDLESIHQYIMNKYNIHSDFPEFHPHLTLAKLQPGEADKYINNEVLRAILADSKSGFEDLVMSTEVEENKYHKFNVTTFHALERFFRESK